MNTKRLAPVVVTSTGRLRTNVNGAKVFVITSDVVGETRRMPRSGKEVPWHVAHVYGAN